MTTSSSSLFIYTTIAPAISTATSISDVGNHMITTTTTTTTTTVTTTIQPSSQRGKCTVVTLTTCSYIYIYVYVVHCKLFMECDHVYLLTQVAS